MFGAFRYNDFMTDCPDGLLRKEVSCLVDVRIPECIYFTIEQKDVIALPLYGYNRKGIQGGKTCSSY